MSDALLVDALITLFRIIETMNHFRLFTLLFLSLLFSVSAVAQDYSVKLNIEVTSVPGDRLKGQKIALKQTDYKLSYGAPALNADGCCSLMVIPGNHLLTIERDGFNTLSHAFFVADDATELTVQVTLTEKTRTPFALKSTVSHNTTTGLNTVALTWNVEEPAFFDDFESYDPFAIQFGEWTGIDADHEMAAPLVGAYPNRGVMQYAQIISPLNVTPTWWYDYPILRPYEGKQIGRASCRERV